MRYLEEMYGKEKGELPCAWWDTTRLYAKVTGEEAQTRDEGAEAGGEEAKAICVVPAPGNSRAEGIARLLEKKKKYERKIKFIDRKLRQLGVEEEENVPLGSLLPSIPRRKRNPRVMPSGEPLKKARFEEEQPAGEGKDIYICFGDA